MTMSLFDQTSDDSNRAEPLKLKQGLCPGAFVLHGFALRDETALLKGLHEVTAKAPFRHMVTPGGFRMSVAMTNCGSLGWVTDRTG
jgi:alkylated DNA repair protein (DNA oxidative demethylase)